MEHQWRQMRPPQPNICPVCSVSHFPFCPPPPFPPCPPHFPPYHQNPRYPPHPDYPRPEAYHSPLPSSHSANPNDGGQRNHSFDYREGFGQSTCGYSNSNSSNGYIGEADRGHKRPRVDEVGSGVLGNENDQNLGKFSMDNERRLKLIRDHGSALSGNLTNLQYNSNFNASRDRNVDNNNQFEYSKKGQPEGGGAYNRFQNDGIVIYSHLEPNGSNQQAPESQSMPYHEVGYGDVNLPQNQVNWQDHRPPQPYGMPDYRPNYQSPGHRASTMDEPVGYLSRFENRVLSGQPPPPRLPPPLPPSPPPPIPMEPPVRQISEFKSYSSPRKTSLFPVPISSSVANPYMQNKSLSLASSAFYSEEWQTSSLPQHLSPDKPTVVDASQLFKQPYRATRPDHIVIILRGLPGSGKSYLAKMMRDLEIENGGNAPRIHSMDDYFMTEVEKIEESDASKFSSLVRGKKAAVKKVMEYCYEPEMEEAYRDSMLKAFRKTLEEGMFSLIIVDDRNLRVADFAQFWAIAKRSGYEVYISEAAYKDPAGCAARNVHGFTLDEIRNMAQQWEESPTLYLQLDMKSLLHGDDLKESGIQEVDMDTEDGAVDDNLSGLQERRAENTVHPPLEDDAPQVPSKDGKTWEAEYDHPTGAKELISSKWSNDLDEDNKEPEGLKENLNALSGLVRAYGKQGKSVCWCDQVGNNGFSIRAAKNLNVMSLVIGPGAGYNLKSNPIPEEESPISTHRSESRRQSLFQEQLRAERESFKAVFEKRRRRIGGLNLEE